ncbi:MAG: hypothetical protein AAF125_21340 [Chloroflexota bacterium]
MYGKINYVDVVNQVTQNGWTIVAQTPDDTRIETQVGIPRVPGILLSLVPVIGALLAALWIYTRGTMSVTIERKLTTARVVTPTNAYDINRREDLETFFTSFDYRGNIGYYPVVITGIVVVFIIGVLIQVAA